MVTHTRDFACSFGSGSVQHIPAASGTTLPGAPLEGASPLLHRFPWELDFVNSTVCSDKCEGHAKDGVCDDGREGRGKVSQYVMLCICVWSAQLRLSLQDGSGQRAVDESDTLIASGSPHPVYTAYEVCLRKLCRSSVTWVQTAQTAGHGYTCISEARRLQPQCKRCQPWALMCTQDTHGLCHHFSCPSQIQSMTWMSAVKCMSMATLKSA